MKLESWYSGGRFMLMKRDLYLKLGFDENCFMYSDDIDLSYRMLLKGSLLLSRNNYKGKVLLRMGLYETVSGSYGVFHKSISRFRGLHLCKQNSIFSLIKMFHQVKKKKDRESYIFILLVMS
jgi:hypothetical protein